MFLLPLMQHFASGATARARNAFGARICYFWLCHNNILINFASGQNKDTHQLNCACHVCAKAYGKRKRTREKGQGLSPQVICWAASASFRSDNDRGSKSYLIITITNNKLALTTSTSSPSTPLPSPLGRVDRGLISSKKYSSAYFFDTLAPTPSRSLQTCGKLWP